MRPLLLFFAFLMALPAFGQITASPGAITVYARRALGAYPWYGTTPPTDTAIAISGTGAWNISRGGTLNSACGNGYGYCFNAVQTVTNLAAGPPASGNGPGTVYLSWRGLGTQDLPLGTYTGTLTIGITVVQITLVVAPANAFDAMVYPPGFPSGCVNSNPNFIQADTCAITGERPASTAFAIPAPGGTYVDPQFGHTVKRLTASDSNIQYSALSAFSATAKYVLTSIGLEGAVRVIDRATSAVTYSSVPGVNMNFAAWDPINDEKLWYMDGGTIRHRILNTGAVFTAADYTNSSGPRSAFPGITMGGTIDITDDGWWAFRDGVILCAVNLNALTPATQESKTFCVSMAALGLTDIDFTQITQTDKESGKRYVVVLSAPKGHVYSVGAAGLNYEFPLPSLLVEPHSDVGEDDQGRQIFFWNFSEIYGSKSYLASMQLNKGLDMMIPVEAGGGLRLLYTSDPADYETDGHFGCTWRGVCVFTPYGNSAGIGVGLISGVTPGTPCGINTAIGHGYASGDQILIGGASGITSINGVFTITVTGPNNYTLNGHTCTSGYTANSANSVPNVATALSKPNRQESIMARPGSEIRRLAMHRSKIYQNGSSLQGYFASPRASISRDGRYVAFASNYGIPEMPSIWVIDTDASITTARVALKGVDAADTKAIINYDVPAGEKAASITISASPDLTAPVVSVSDGGSAVSRQYVAAGLTADTMYYCRIHTGRYSVTGSFRTAPAITGTGTLRVQSGNGSMVQHGATAALGSSGASPLEVTVSRGVYYYNAGGGTQAVVVR